MMVYVLMTFTSIKKKYLETHFYWKKHTYKSIKYGDQLTQFTDFNNSFDISVVIYFVSSWNCDVMYCVSWT